MKQALAIRHLPFEDLDAFEPVLRGAGYDIRRLDAPVDALAPAREAELLVVLGGPVGANDEDRYPFLAREKDIIRARHAAGLPTLGICLGAQLIGVALGARLHAGAAREVGWHPLRLSGAGRHSPLRHLDGVAVFHWHSDAVELPAGAEALAATETCANQAFRLGRMLALQFHPEVSARGLEHWYVGHTRELQAHGSPTVDELRAAAARQARLMAEPAARMLEDWLRDIA